MTSPCSNALLEAALIGNLPAEEEAVLHQHLEECAECSSALERMAGGTAWSQEARALLSQDELDEKVFPRDDGSDVDFSVDYLEPADEPNVLGRLGGYDVLEIIGRGGMGVVLKGYDRELKRCVAIKVLAPHLAHNSLAKKRFAREAQAAAAVVHPNVLAIHQVQAGGRLPFLVMPLVAGETLAQRLKEKGTLELKEILRIGMQAAAGLAAAHEQGLVHRDVKPANILLEKGVERAVLTDFGLARAADDVSVTHWGIVAGTPEYMSPEQARGEPLDGRSDLFSLGCVLYQMATGVSPFRADSTMATMRRLIDDPPQALASLNPELPPWFIAIVERLLEKDPPRRFGAAKEVSELLEGCLAHLQQPAGVPLPPGFPFAFPPKVSKRRSILLNGIIALIAFLGLALGIFLVQTTAPPDISGQWSGEGWGQVVLQPTGRGQYTGTYTETVGKEPGKIELRWSRIERRFNGKWSEGEDRFGELSIRLVDQEIRGALTTDPKSRINPATPRLADLVWTRGSGDLSWGMRWPATWKLEFLNLPNVQKELNLTDDQKTKVKDALEKYRIAELPPSSNPSREERQKQRENLEDLKKGISDLLLPKQLDRLKEINLQFQGARALGDDKDVQEALGITAGQKEKFQAIQAFWGKKMQEFCRQEKRRGQLDDHTIILKSLTFLKGLYEDYLKVLDPDQQAKYEKMKGVKVDFPGVIGPESPEIPSPGSADWKAVELTQPKPAGDKPVAPNSLPRQIIRYLTKNRVAVVAYSPDGKTMAMGGDPNRVHLCNGQTGKGIAAFNLFSKEEVTILAAAKRTVDEVEVRAFAFSPEASVVAVGNSIGQVKLFDVRTGAFLSLDDVDRKASKGKSLPKFLELRLAQGNVWAIAFSPDGKMLATCGDAIDYDYDGVRRLERSGLGPRAGLLKLWDAKTGKLIKDLKGEHSGQVLDVAFSPDGKYLASAGNWPQGNGVKLWDPNAGKVTKVLAVPRGHLGGGSCLCFHFSPDGKRMAMGIMQYDKSTDVTSGSINVVYPASGILDLSWRLPRSVRPVAFSPDGRTIAAFNGKSTLMLWDSSTGMPKGEIPPAGQAEGERWEWFAFAPKGDRLAIGGIDAEKRGFVEVWDIGGVSAGPLESPPKK